MARVLAAGIAFLQRFKQRFKGSADDEEETEGRRDVKPAAEQQAETAPAPRRRLRSFLVMLGVGLLAGGLSMGAAYSLLSKVLKDQSAKLESQQQDLSALQLQEQAQSVKLAELMKKLDVEQMKRLEAEKKLAEIDVKRLETAAKEGAALPQQESEVTRSLRPSRSSTFRPPAPAKVIDCNVLGGDPAALKRCLDEFNRK